MKKKRQKQDDYTNNNAFNNCSACNSKPVDVSMDKSLSGFIADANTKTVEFGVDNFAGVTDNAPYNGAPGYFMIMTEKSINKNDDFALGETINNQGS